MVMHAFFLVVFCSWVGTSTSYLLRGSVTCLDCTTQHNLSGVIVAARCKDYLLPVSTNFNGYFQVEIPEKSSDVCTAKLLGGQKQLCAYEKSMSSKIIKPRGYDHYALATPLTFLTSCPQNVGQQRPQEMIDVQRTRDARSPPRARAVNQSPPSRAVNQSPPSPYGYGLPLIYLFPFFPIIGIP